MSFHYFGAYAAALTLAGLLAACETAPDEAALGAGTESAPELVDDSAALDAEGAGEAGSDPAPELAIETGATAPEVAVPPPEPVPPEPVIDDDPKQLFGLGPAALDQLLGRPSLIRTEDPAQIWQYRSQTCVFDVFLYEEAGQSRVTYIEARDGAAAQIEARYCLNELLRARKGLPLG